MRHILCVSHEWNLGPEALHNLAVSGFRLTSAANGFEALRLFTTSIFDAVIVNRRLPDMTIHEFVGMVKNCESELPVIMVSTVMPAPEKPQSLDAVIGLPYVGSLLAPTLEILVPVKAVVETAFSTADDLLRAA